MAEFDELHAGYLCKNCTFYHIMKDLKQQRLLYIELQMQVIMLSLSKARV